jgi:hypothetical protein
MAPVVPFNRIKVSVQEGAYVNQQNFVEAGAYIASAPEVRFQNEHRLLRERMGS